MIWILLLNILISLSLSLSHSHSRPPSSHFKSTKGVRWATTNCHGGNGNDKVISLPNLMTPGSLVPTRQYSGYIQVNASHNGSLFYWFFEAMDTSIYDDPKDIPFLVWANGGPGASSMTGLFTENGIYQMWPNQSVTVKNAMDTWNHRYHMIFVDNPVGTGYSFIKDNAYVDNEDAMGRNFVTLLNGFFVCHPEYAKNPLYLTGESYAGRYIPFIAKWILNDTYSGGSINLAGLAIGNGHFNPYIQFYAPLDYAYMHGILDTFEYRESKSQIDYCLNNLTKVNNDTAAELCTNVTNDVYSVYGGNIFQYDIRVTDIASFDAPGDAMDAWCQRDDVKEAIHTSGVYFLDSDGTEDPNPVYNALKADVMANDTGEVILKILDEGVRILFYNGQFDGSVWNNYGNQLFLDEMNYKGIWNNPNMTVKRPFLSPMTNLTIGYVKVFEQNPSDSVLTLFIVSSSGHLVPTTVPYNSQVMIQTWIDHGF